MQNFIKRAKPILYMNIIQKVKSIIVEPVHFFQRLKSEKGIMPAFVYLIILSLIPLVLGTFFNWMFGTYTALLMTGFFGLEPTPQNSIILLFTLAIAGYVFGLILSFVWAGLLHVWILIWGGKADYSKTYQLSVYAQTPRFIFGWIPLIGGLIWVYDLVLLIIGTQKVHNIPKTKSILIYVIPVAAFVLLFVIIMIAGIALFASQPGFAENLANAMKTAASAK